MKYVTVTRLNRDWTYVTGIDDLEKGDIVVAEFGYLKQILPVKSVAAKLPRGAHTGPYKVIERRATAAEVKALEGLDAAYEAFEEAKVVYNEAISVANKVSKPRAARAKPPASRKKRAAVKRKTVSRRRTTRRKSR